MSADLVQRLRHGDGCAGEHIPGAVTRYEDTITEAADRIEALEEALSVYADPEKWKVKHQGMGNHFRAIDAVQERLAREALDA